MRIGQLSKKTGLSRDTIRFYEKQGLIPTAPKENEFNSYKNYSNETLEKLLVIKKMKGFGLTLNEISDFLDLLALNSASCENVAEKMFEKIRLIDEKITLVEIADRLGLSVEKVQRIAFRLIFVGLAKEMPMMLSEPTVDTPESVFSGETGEQLSPKFFRNLIEFLRQVPKSS